MIHLAEIVKPAQDLVLVKWTYNEPYLAVPMSHAIDLSAEAGGSVAYEWRYHGATFALSARASGAAQTPDPSSEAAFITEHYWGYTRQRDGGTIEYHVEHPVWRVWTADHARFDGPSGQLYGSAVGEILTQPPRSAFVAVGSAVSVHKGRPLT